MSVRLLTDQVVQKTNCVYQLLQRWKRFSLAYIRMFHVVLTINIYRVPIQIFISFPVRSELCFKYLLRECCSSNPYGTKTPNMAETAWMLSRDVTKQLCLWRRVLGKKKDVFSHIQEVYFLYWNSKFHFLTRALYYTLLKLMKPTTSHHIFFQDAF